MTAIGIIARWVVLEVVRRKDGYVLLVLLLAMLVGLAGVNAFGIGGSARYVKDAGLSLAWLFSVVLAIPVAARQLPQGERTGTVFVLLSKPVARSQLILGAWLGSTAAVGLAVAAFYATVAGAAALMGGRWSMDVAAQALALHLAATGLFVALTLALSTRLSSGAAQTIAFVILGFCFAFVPDIPQVLVHGRGFSSHALLVLYYGLPHLEIFDLRPRLVHDGGPAPWGAVAAAFGYGLCWIGALLGAGIHSYRRRYFRRPTS